MVNTIQLKLADSLFFPPRLMVNLTQPALVCFGKLPQDASFRHHFLQTLSYLQAYKEVSG